jgi:NSS family neurotransmitter:Na+ symporter
LTQTGTREQWGSRIGFILAAAGSAIGLGNIWRFPTTTGDNGGGIFVIIYVACVLILGAPIMLAEFTIGRSTQTNAVGSFRKLAPGTPWFMVGGMGVIAGFLILSYYSVVGGWIIGYMVDSVRGILFTFGSHAALDAHFKTAAQNPAFSIGYLLVFMGFTIFIIYRGVGQGIERWSKILMPILFLLLLMIIVRGLTMPNSLAGLSFLFVPNFEKFGPGTLSAAMGQAFFSLSLGMGTMITYGSYLSRKQNLPNSALQIAGLDTIAALLAGMAIFPALFAITPELSADMRGGPGLIFVAFPRIFLSMFGGNVLLAQLFGFSFFLLVLIAAITSSISLLEVVVAYFVDERGWARRKAAVIMGTVIFFIGIPSALSNVDPDRSFTFLGKSIFTIVDMVATAYMLPIGGLFISIFVAWRWQKAACLGEARSGGATFRLGPLWLMILRWIAPFVIAQIIILRIINDLWSNVVFKSSPAFVINLQWVFTSVDAVVNKYLSLQREWITVLQWAFTAVDALMLAGAVIGGFYCWFRKREPEAVLE